MHSQSHLKLIQATRQLQCSLAVIKSTATQNLDLNLILWRNQRTGLAQHITIKFASNRLGKRRFRTTLSDRGTVKSTFPWIEIYYNSQCMAREWGRRRAKEQVPCSLHFQAGVGWVWNLMPSPPQAPLERARIIIAMLFQLTFSSFSRWKFCPAHLQLSAPRSAFIINYKLSSRVFKLVFKIITFCVLFGVCFSAFSLFTPHPSPSPACNFYLCRSSHSPIPWFVSATEKLVPDSNHVYNDNGS